MEEVLGFLGFSVGASFGVSMVRSVGTGAQPALREALKIGIRAWDGLANAAGSVSQEVRQARADAAAESQASAPSPSRKIVVARE